MSRLPRDQQDRGSALLLAIGFVLMVGAISAGLAALATSSMNNRATLQLVRNRQYAADGAIEQSISQVRAFTCATPGGSIPATLNSVAIRVDWVNACGVVKSADTGTVVSQRNVIFSAYCKNPTDATCNFTDVIIRAQVNFQELPSATYVQSWSVNR
ncbi:MAG: hypothetical protein QOE09_1810 [Ilumatobacteraceae bacterium]